jgi:hypothetical protein
MNLHQEKPQGIILCGKRFQRKAASGEKLFTIFSTLQTFDALEFNNKYIKINYKIYYTPSP